MADELDYVWEKFRLAVESLATSKRSLQERLADAYADNFVQLRAKDLPEPIRADFLALKVALDRVETGGGSGTLYPSAATLSDEDAARLIRSIVSMCDEVAQLFAGESDT